MQFLPYAWAVEFGKDLHHALFNERPRAEQYAADSHWVLVPLYDLRELPQAKPGQADGTPAS